MADELRRELVQRHRVGAQPLAPRELRDPHPVHVRGRELLRLRARPLVRPPHAVPLRLAQVQLALRGMLLFVRQLVLVGIASIRAPPGESTAQRAAGAKPK